MHIAVDIRHLTHPRLSGVGLYTLNVLRALDRIPEAEDDTFTLFVAGSKNTRARLPALPRARMQLVEHALPNRVLYGLLSLPGTTLEQFLPNKPDAWWFPEETIIRTRLPYALTVHDLARTHVPECFRPKDHARAFVARVDRLRSHASRILAVSHATARDLRGIGVSENLIAVTQLGVGSQYAPNEVASDKNYLRGYGLKPGYILALATHEPRKNLESIILAYETLRSYTSEVPPLVLAGAKGWKTKRLERLLAASPYRNDILVLGYVHENHKPALYRGAAVFVFPSFYEGFGLPVLEAMASGTPVLTSTTSAMPEVAGEAALFVDPFNVHDLTSALAELLVSPDGQNARRAMTRAGIERARGFSWDDTARQTLAAFRSLTK